MRLVILVSLRTAASAMAPLAPMWLSSRLRARGKMGTVREYKRVNGALTRKRTLGIGGALEVGDTCLLEDGSECGGTLVSDAVAVETAT